MTRLSLVTNASVADDLRIRNTLPNWLRVFGERLREVVIVVDETAPTGRIAHLHPSLGSNASLLAEIAELERLDSRVRHTFFPGDIPVEKTARGWFRRGVPVRCQAGTPILAFARAFDSASEDLVLRTDCDMLFVEAGWFDVAVGLLSSGAAELVEPPRLGNHERSRISTRALLLARSAFARECLPMKAHRLGAARSLHRWLYGRPTWIPFEQMLQREKQIGRLRHLVLEDSLGYSMHVSRRDDARAESFDALVSRFERGAIPRAQREEWNFLPAAWHSASRSSAPMIHRASNNCGKDLTEAHYGFADLDVTRCEVDKGPPQEPDPLRRTRA